MQRSNQARRASRWIAGGLMVTVALLVACHGGNSGSTSQPVQSAARTAPAASTLTAAVSGDGALPVEVRFGIGSLPVVGQPIPVKVVVSTNLAQPALWVHLHGDEGLDVQEPLDRRLERIDAGAAEVLDLALTASSPGAHLVTVDVVLDLPTSAPDRTFQFPVLVTAR